MLLPQKLEIKWHSKNRQYFESLGYKYTKQFEKFIIDVKDLKETYGYKVKIQCDFCDKIIERRYYAYVETNKKGKGRDCCNKCIGKKLSKARLDNSESLEDKFPDIAKEWSNKNEKSPKEYSYGSSIKVWWICNNGHEYEMSIHARTNPNKSGCPHCSPKKSKGEEEIIKFLEKNNINYKREYSFKDLLSENNKPLKFDFAIFENNNLKLLIEFDGGQHFEVVNLFGEEHFKNTQYRDGLKNNYCKENNIKLIRIPYWEFNNIEEIIKREA